ncbi:MAG: hypothetical protein KDK23_05990 [Leptospiraceae bacterium]|nr:hypothetical protein [Leptospiraceae bacterium]
MRSLLFRVNLDGENARWTNLSRVVGLVGLLLFVLGKVFEGQGWEIAANILYVPGALLALGNLVWIYLIPSLFMLVLYSIAYAVIAIVNFLHIVVLQKNNEELVYFMTKFLNMRTRVSLSVLGVTHRVPHVDLYASDSGPGSVGLRFKTREDMPVRWILFRLAILLGVFIVFSIFSLGIRYIPYFTYVLGGLFGLVGLILVLTVLVIWIHNAITGQFIGPLVDLHLRLMRLNLTVTSYFTFVTNEISEFKHCLRSVLDESVPGDLPAEWVNPNDARRLDINLVALVVLIGSTQGLYLFIWLARTSKLMGDDPFTIIAVTALGSLLPLSVIFSRYYRRLEKKTGNDPSWVLELLMVMPILNLIVGTFTIQYILNLGKKSARTAG